MFPLSPFPPKPSEEEKPETRLVDGGDPLPFCAYTILSVLLAAGGVLVPLLDTRPIFFTRVPVMLPFSIAWTLCIHYGHRSHGKRAMWLVIGFPFAWSYLVLGVLFIIGVIWRGGGV